MNWQKPHLLPVLSHLSGSWLRSTAVAALAAKNIGPLQQLTEACLVRNEGMDPRSSPYTFLINCTRPVNTPNGNRWNCMKGEGDKCSRGARPPTHILV